MKQVKLFLLSVGAGYLALYFWDKYPTFLHEVNHLFAALLSGNIPIGFTLKNRVVPAGYEVGGLAYIFPITSFIPVIDDFIGVSGAGLAVGAPGIVWILGQKLHLSWISGFWIAGIPEVLSDWGRAQRYRNSDFYGVNVYSWIPAMVLVTLLIYVVALWRTAVHYEQRLNAEAIRQRLRVRRGPVRVPVLTSGMRVAR